MNQPPAVPVFPARREGPHQPRHYTDDLLAARARADATRRDELHQEQRREANDMFKDRFLASGEDRYVKGPLFRWDWNDGGANRDRFWESKLRRAYDEIDHEDAQAGRLTFGCPPVPPPQGSKSELVWMDLRQQGQLKGNKRAHDTAERIRQDMEAVIAPEHQALWTREDYIIWQGYELGCIEHDRAAIQRYFSSSLFEQTKMPPSTPLQRYAQQSAYAEYAFYLRRLDHTTANMIREKELVMNAFESAGRGRRSAGKASSTSRAHNQGPSAADAFHHPYQKSMTARKWDKAERAWNKRLFAEQVGWQPPERWCSMEPTSKGPRDNALWHITGLVPGFVPPPNWPLTPTQFAGLQKQGSIPPYAPYTGVMPWPERGHLPGAGKPSEYGKVRLGFQWDPPCDSNESTKLNSPPTEQDTEPCSTPSEEMFSFVGYDAIQNLPSCTSGQTSSDDSARGLPLHLHASPLSLSSSDHGDGESPPGGVIGETRMLSDG